MVVEHFPAVGVHGDCASSHFHSSIPSGVEKVHMLCAAVNAQPMTDHWDQWTLDSFQVSEFHCTYLQGVCDGRPHEGFLCQTLLMGPEAGFQECIVELLRVFYCHGDTVASALESTRLMW